MSFRQIASQTARALRLSCNAQLDRPFLYSIYNFYSTGRKYLPSHEWVEVNGDVGTVGISNFAQQELGEVVFVELPEAGAKLEKGSTFGVVESVKAASDVYSPVSGTVVEANEILGTDPGLVNSAPLEDGWLIKVKLDNHEEVKELLDETAYSKSLEDKH